LGGGEGARLGSKANFLIFIVKAGNTTTKPKVSTKNFNLFYFLFYFGGRGGDGSFATLLPTPQQRNFLFSQLMTLIYPGNCRKILLSCKIYLYL